jgi:hypothetical protein
MWDVLLCVAIILLLIWLISPDLLYGDDVYSYGNYGYATSGPASAPAAAASDSAAGNGYNDYLQSVALEPAIKQQHNSWLNNLQINLQPSTNSIRDDCDDGETPRWGLLKKDYSNDINPNQNISIPSGRTCTEGDGGNSRWGGYGIGLCPVQRSI